MRNIYNIFFRRLKGIHVITKSIWEDNITTKLIGHKDNVQTYWVFGHCPSSGILKTELLRLALSEGPRRADISPLT
jgi:hypothetical protein